MNISKVKNDLERYLILEILLIGIICTKFQNANVVCANFLVFIIENKENHDYQVLQLTLKFMAEYKLESTTMGVLSRLSYNTESLRGQQSLQLLILEIYMKWTRDENICINQQDAAETIVILEFVITDNESRSDEETSLMDQEQQSQVVAVIECLRASHRQEIMKSNILGKFYMDFENKISNNINPVGLQGSL